MKTLTKAIAASTVIVALTGSVFAASHVDPAIATAMEARETHMKALGAQVGILGNMAQEKAPYDATAAAAAATTLAGLAAEDLAVYFPEGSDSVSVEGSRALPIIWENAEDFKAKEEALTTATAALVLVAGTDLDSLKAGFGPVGAACGACHETYRAPKQ
jgi:cytochrome c556